MGLGILFFGYFLSTIVALPYPAYASLAAYLIIGYAATKLMQYERSFSYVRLACGLMLALSLPSAVSFTCELIGVPLSLPAFLTESVYYYAESVGKLLFHIALYIAILRLATDTNEEKLRVASARNLFFYGLLFMADTVFRMLSLLGGEFSKLASSALLVCSLVYILIIILNHVMLFGAYMRICDPDDYNMELKDTGIGWLDRLRHKTAENEQRAADETQKYLQDRYDAKHASSGKKKKKKR